MIIEPILKAVHVYPFLQEMKNNMINRVDEKIRFQLSDSFYYATGSKLSGIRAAIVYHLAEYEL